jgi:hypothetical protein
MTVAARDTGVRVDSPNVRNPPIRLDTFASVGLRAHAVGLHAGQDPHSCCDATPLWLAKRRGLRADSALVAAEPILAEVDALGC